MSNENKPHIDDLYPKFRRMVSNICRKFLNRLPGEELEDLTQTCWEQIVRKYGGFDPIKSTLSTWITIVSRSTMYDMLKAAQADKRAIQMHLTSIDQMTNGKDKYL